jgi:hypothetical protein
VVEKLDCQCEEASRFHVVGAVVERVAAAAVGGVAAGDVDRVGVDGCLAEETSMLRPGLEVTTRKSRLVCTLGRQMMQNLLGCQKRD